MKAAFYVGNATMRTGPQTAIEPTLGKVQIQVAYCGICGTDLHIFHGKMDHRVHLPQVMGHEMSGTISALGPGVEGFSVGDSGDRDASRSVQQLPGLPRGSQPHLPEPEVHGH